MRSVLCIAGFPLRHCRARSRAPVGLRYSMSHKTSSWSCRMGADSERNYLKAKDMPDMADLLIGMSPCRSV